MNFEATIAIRVKVPFKKDAAALDVEQFHGPGPRGKPAIVDRDGYHDQLAKVEKDRAAVARHAEKVAASVAKKLGGGVVEVVVEEVSEA